jgi:hypothetical protein
MGESSDPTEATGATDSTDPTDTAGPTDPDRIDRLTGALAVVGGLCLLVASVPSRFYTGPPTDSYIFDPPPFSGLWVQRVVIPVLAVLALLGVFAAVVGLLRRDRGEGRWHDVAGGLTVFGAAMLLFAGLLLAGTGSLSGGSPDVIGALVVTVGALGGLLAALLAIVAGAVWGVGYLRRGRRRLGGTLVAVPLGTLLLVALTTFVELPIGAGVVAVLPTVAGVGVIGVDLWQGPAEDSSSVGDERQDDGDASVDDGGDRSVVADESSTEMPQSDESSEQRTSQSDDQGA